jgi:hypothetical protein
MLSWSQGRLVGTLVLAWLAILEPVSWVTSRILPCIVNANDYGTYYAQNQECPAFHVFLIKLASAILEKLGEPAWATVAATIVIAAFTGTLWWSTHKLWKAGEKHSERQLRAYVNVIDAFITHANDEWSPNFRIKIKNNGQTPAFKVIDRSSVKSVFIGGPPSFNDLPKEVTHCSDLGPGQEHGHTLIIHRDPWQLLKSAIEKHIGTCYVFAEITYFDTFGGKHFTRYRLQVGADDEGVSDGGLFFSAEGNESD